MFCPHPPPRIYHPCEAEDCKCPVTTRLISHIHKRPYEVQMDRYKCGPVAIINALIYLEKDPGPALRRSIITQCKTSPIHSDGFKGTKPDDINLVIQKVIPQADHFIGIDAAISAFKNRAYTAYIVLYSDFHHNKKQFYHYTFTFKKESGPVSGSRSRSPLLLSQNDGSYGEIESTLETYVAEHFSIEGTTPIEYPQVWAIKRT